MGFAGAAQPDARATAISVTQASWWYVALPMDVLRVSGVKCAKGCQTTFNFIAQVRSKIETCSDHS